MVIANDRRDPSETETLGRRIVDFRTGLGVSREDLAAKLGITPVTLLRWERGTSKPSASAARALVDLGLGPIGNHDTKAHSTPRSTLFGQEARRSEIRATVNYGATSRSFHPAPYVLNGPADQLDFFEELYRLQESASPLLSEQSWRRRLSCVYDVEGEPTAMAALENRSLDSKSWDGNYGPHGWHRYVGRFPPHLVRALLNHFEARPGQTVCDPFTGSGTTLVEARMLGLRAVGIDLCPLSCMLSRTKSKFPDDPRHLSQRFNQFSQHFEGLLAGFTKAHPSGTYPHNAVVEREGNAIPKFANMERWFTPEALLGTSVAVELIMQEEGYARDLFATALSAEMRSIGNVDVDVVRAEYRKTARVGVDVLRLVSRRVKKMLAGIDRTLRSHEGLIGSPDDIDVREENMLSTDLAEGSVDYIVTSPPYGVESLSYLRTHLLSYRSLDAHFKYDPYSFSDDAVGSEYLAADASAAGSVATSLSPTFASFFSEGFDGTDPRRVAMMEKFFDDLVQVGANFQKWLRPGGAIAFVIGNKRLGERVIPTDIIVGELFSNQGLRLEKTVEHKLKTNNSNSEVPWQERIIQNEAVLIFRRA